MIGLPLLWLIGRIAALAAFGSAAAVAGCAPAPLRASFESPNPTERLYAVERAVRQRDLNAVPHIIELLGSDDPAVRMIAITALERLTGETYGYVHYAPRHEREEAILRWMKAHGEQGTGNRGQGTSKRQNVRTSKRQNVETSKRQNVRMLKRENELESLRDGPFYLFDVLTFRRFDVSADGGADD